MFSLVTSSIKYTINFKNMKNLLYLLALIILIGWAIGFIGYHVGGLIHILLIIALISVLLGIIQGRRL